MRPQGFGQSAGGLDDLGWNDMGFEPPKPSSTPLRDVHAAEDAAQRVPFAGLTPLESPVHTQQAELADRLSGAPAEEVDEEFVQPVLEQPALVEALAFEPETTAPVEAPAFEPEPTTAVEPDVEQAPEIPLAVAAPAPRVAAPRRAPKARSAPGSGAKAAFTLRLDPERHLKLRLACAIGNRSAQQLVTDALDQLLAAMPELDAMADKAKRKGS
nr:hypothetical protein [Sphingomonas piscis]